MIDQTIISAPRKVMHEIVPREVKLSSIKRLNQHFTRLVLSGESLHSFSSPSFDDHVKLVFENKEGKTIRRNYTPIFVSADKGELTIDIALHENGEAMTWLNSIKEGDKAVIAGPRMSMLIHDDYKKYWFIGDATALPAINRKLLALPSSAEVTVFVQGEHIASQVIGSNKNAIKTSVIICGSDESVLEKVNQKLDELCSNTFVWAACEYSLAQQLKLNIDHPNALTRIASYWRNGENNHHKELSL